MVNGFRDARTKIDRDISSRFVIILRKFFMMSARESPVLLKDHTTCKDTTYNVSGDGSRYLRKLSCYVQSVSTSLKTFMYEILSKKYFVSEPRSTHKVSITRTQTA
jgi:hypothetical protein